MANERIEQDAQEHADAQDVTEQSLQDVQNKVDRGVELPDPEDHQRHPAIQHVINELHRLIDDLKRA